MESHRGRWQWRIEHEKSTPTREEEERVQRLDRGGWIHIAFNGQVC